jgi:hypothetical protein
MIDRVVTLSSCSWGHEDRQCRAPSPSFPHGEWGRLCVLSACTRVVASICRLVKGSNHAQIGHLAYIPSEIS